MKLKHVQVCIFIILFSTLFLFTTPIFADEQYKEWPSKTTYNQHHRWTIKFNTAFDKYSLIDNIYIVDSKGNKIDTNLLIDQDYKQVMVDSLIPYNYNELYTLYIIKNIKSESGKPLKESIKFTFSVIKRPE